MTVSCKEPIAGTCYKQADDLLIIVNGAKQRKFIARTFVQRDETNATLQLANFVSARLLFLFFFFFFLTKVDVTISLFNSFSQVCYL